MKIGVPKDTAPGETRVAIVPETVKRLVKRGLEVVVEPEAGAGAFFSDDDYRAAGAQVDASAIEAEVVVKIRHPDRDEAERLTEGAALVCLCYPLLHPETVDAAVERRGTLVAADMIPRTTLAQSMDVLSSQATVAGYRAALLAAGSLPRFFPMMITAAGTIVPATVLVLGAGVAGLQAIATAHRLGAVVQAFDVRKAVREQVESLGAKFVVVDEGEDAEAEGGYARETSPEYARRQREVLGERLARADACIATALIPGRRAPLLITEDMVKAMRPGSVIVDLAAEQGGNCELTEPGQEVIRHEVRIHGPLNLPAAMPVHASQMYSRNMEKLLLHLMGEGNAPRWDFGDEIVRGCVVVHAGRVVHEKLRARPLAAAGRP